MKNSLYATAIVFALVLTPLPVGATGGTGNPEWEYPEIKSFGRIQPLPEAANQPSPDKTYKAVFDVTKKTKDMGQPNPGLDHVARAVNVFAGAHVARDNRDFIAVIHGAATPSVLSDGQYEKKFGQKNPNTSLIKALADAGVSVHVCGQALAEHDFDQASVNPNVDVVLSALSDLIIYGNRGYALVSQ